MPTIFTRIIDGDLPGTFVWRDERAVAFLSINPLRPGHTLVVPRLEVDHWIDCPLDLQSHLFEVAQHIGRAIERAWRPVRVGVVIAGLEVPHLHLHVSPIWNLADLSFAHAAASVSRHELDDAAGRIRAELRAMGIEQVSD
jgi:diadenosine tetraphosphate (Ap4A) HIT family hydrolase